jgi:hypothetical protein
MAVRLLIAIPLDVASRLLTDTTSTAVSTAVSMAVPLPIKEVEVSLPRSLCRHKVPTPSTWDL